VLAFDAVQEVALVLVGIARLEQLRAVGRVFEARVVAGGEAPRAEPRRVVEAHAELDLAVAEHVRVGRAAGAVLGEEVVEHALAVVLGEAHAVQRDAELGGGGASVLEILGRGAVVVVLVPVAHVEPVHLVTGAHQQQRGHRGVDSAGHADHDPFAWVFQGRGLYRPAPARAATG
jgi:hypothetical protein